MITVSVTDNLKEITQGLDDLAKRQLPFVTAKAVTFTARAIKDELSNTMKSVFDNPNPYTLRSTFATSATKSAPESTIGVRDQKPSRGVAPATYLKEHFGGGDRGNKPMEKAMQALGVLPRGWLAMPAAGMKLDRYGNPDKRQVTEILGALKSGARIFAGRGKRQSLQGYFIVKPGETSERARHLAPGVWRRIQRSGDSSVVPVFVFADGASYRDVIDLPKIAQDVINRKFGLIFSDAMNQAIATAR